MFKKIAENIEQGIELSFEVPDSEKQIATLANERFESVIGSLQKAVKHLDTIYKPFKEADQLDKKDVVKRRGALNRFKQKIIENFNNVKKGAFLALKEINYFAVDDTIQQIINSFVNIIGDLEILVNDLVEILDDITSQSYKDDIVSKIESIQKQADQLEDFINERVIDYIDTNILAKNWISDTDSGIESEIVEKMPLIVKLINEREQNFNDMMADTKKPQQSLNPSDAQRIWYPDFSRTVDIGEK